MIAKIKPYWKTVVACIGALVGWGQLVVASEPAEITANEWMLLAIGLATAAGVYGVKNQPG